MTSSSAFLSIQNFHIRQPEILIIGNARREHEPQARPSAQFKQWKGTRASASTVSLALPRPL